MDAPEMGGSVELIAPSFVPSFAALVIFVMEAVARLSHETGVSDVRKPWSADVLAINGGLPRGNM
jgi:hypothetical protein